MCMVIDVMTILQCYNLASRNSLLLQSAARTLEMLLHFYIFLLNPNNDLELDYLWKADEPLISMIYCAYGNIVTFHAHIQTHFC